jgi:hypothetical protein
VFHDDCDAQKVALHIRSVPFTGPLPLAPALRCSAVVSGECSMASFLCSGPVTIKSSQESTALKFIVFTSVDSGPGLHIPQKCADFGDVTSVKTGGSRPARRLTFFNAKKVSKKACSCGGHFLLRDLWHLLTLLNWKWIRSC